MILLVLFYVFIEQKNVKVSADELVGSYQSNAKEADKIFLNKEIELRGKVKSYYEFENENNLLQVRIERSDINLYCIIMNKETDEKAKPLTSGTAFTAFGNCVGLWDSIPSGKDSKFPHSIYIETEDIK